MFFFFVYKGRLSLIWLILKIVMNLTYLERRTAVNICWEEWQNLMVIWLQWSSRGVTWFVSHSVHSWRIGNHQCSVGWYLVVGSPPPPSQMQKRDSGHCWHGCILLCKNPVNINRYMLNEGSDYLFYNVSADISTNLIYEESWRLVTCGTLYIPWTSISTSYVVSIRVKGHHLVCPWAVGRYSVKAR